MYVDDVIQDGNSLIEFAHIKAIMDVSFKIKVLFGIGGSKNTKGNFIVPKQILC